MDIEMIARKIALQNAIEHNGNASIGSVIGKILGQHPELKQNIQDIQSLANKIVTEINLLSVDEQKQELEDILASEGKDKTTKERSSEAISHPKGLPEIPELTGKKIVVRFAPNPDGAIHLGNARPAILSDEFRKQYNGKFILRFDDTDPKVKIPEKKFYDWIKEDLKWLGVKWNEEVITSKRLKTYYKYAEKLIKINAAYVCVCNPAIWKELRNRGEPCPCRELPIKEQLRKWKKMLNANYNSRAKRGYLPKTIGKFKEGQAVLRIKTDISHPNPAIRDWPAMRIVDKPKHPLEKRARLWPLYNFASAIDDHLTGVNLILRGQEHATNDEKQKYLYGHLGWEYPKVLILGRFMLPDFVLSKSLTRKGIEEGKFTGWDDPKLGTICTMRRRGISAQAIRNLIVEIGVQSNDAIIDFENLAAHNKKIIDKIANRYFFVQDPEKIRVKYKFSRAKLPLHPEKKNKFRNLSVNGDIFVNKEDLEKFENKDTRLIGLYNIILRRRQSCPVIAIGEEAHKQAKQRHLPKIHWLPADKKQTTSAEIIKPEGIVKGLVEKNILKEKIGSVVQFERFGFVRLEKITKNKIVGVFGHR